MFGTVGDRYEGAFWNLHEAVSNRHFQGAYHTATIERDLAVVVYGGVDYHLDTVDVG